jgi:diacylglycerol kinase family enzyme
MSAPYLLVANPTSQSGKNAGRIETARELLGQAGLEHDFQPTLPGGATVDAVSALLKKRDYATVIYMGGDGTFAEVAKGILKAARGKKVRLGMLPTGTANDQGRSFGLDSAPTELPRNVQVIKEGHERALDAGKIVGLSATGEPLKEDLFFDSAGWGISPRVLQMRNEDRKTLEAIPILGGLWSGKLVYAGALLRTFLASYVDETYFGVDIEADGKHHSWEKLTDLIVKGTQIYGGSWIFDKLALPDDGKFEVVPFTGKRDWISKAIVHHDTVPIEPENLAKIGITHSEGFSASRIEITFQQAEGSRPLAAQIDGEEFPIFPRMRIEVLPQALRLIVPGEYASPQGAGSGS